MDPIRPFSLGALHAVAAGGGPTALYLHGGLLDGDLFRPQLLGLADASHGVALDLPGFGASAPLAIPLTIPALADAVLQAAVDLPGPWDLVGLSLGAAVALQIAARRPDRVRSLCLISVGRATPRGSADIQRMKDSLAATTRAAMAEAFAGRMMASGADPSLHRRVRAMAEGTATDTVLALYELMGDYPAVLDDAVAMTIPMLILAGDQDASVDRPRLQSLTSAAARREVLFVPGAGHLPTLEQPQFVNTALAAFWRRVAQDPPA